jgi:hypothetical protein
MTNNSTPPAGGYAPNATLTLREIADLTGHDLSTIKAWNNKGHGKWPNAKQDPDGLKTWRVPISDLIASGDIDPSQIVHVENELAALRESRETRALREQIARLEEQLIAARAIAEDRAATIAWLKDLVRGGGAA